MYFFEGETIFFVAKANERLENEFRHRNALEISESFFLISVFNRSCDTHSSNFNSLSYQAKC